MKRRLPIAVLLAALVLAAGLAPAWGQGKAGEAKGVDVVDHMMRSTCFIIVEHTDKIAAGKVPYARGSGSLIVNKANRKFVLTNYHVVGKYDEAWIMFPMRLSANSDVVAEPERYVAARRNPQYSIRGEVRDRWPEKDLALIELKVDAAYNFSRLRSLPIAEKSPKQGSQVHTMGNPAASGLWSYTKGDVRTVYETTRTFNLGPGDLLKVNARVIDTTNPLSGGDSGGPLVNDKYEQVGVAQSVASNASSVSSFIAIEEVWAFLKRTKLDREVTTGGRTVAAAKEETAKEDKPAPTKPTSPAPPPLSDEEKKAKNEKYATGMLKLAKEMSGAQRRDYLEDLISRYPGTEAAKEAAELLKKGK